jgi:glycosyltransferase involved in cell wall biosynthesis
MILINGSFIGRRITGLQRYAWELSRRLCTAHGDVQVLAPRGEAHEGISPGKVRSVKAPILSRIIKHSWDIHLGKSVGKEDLLWSPCNLGPAIGNHVVTLHDIAPFRNPEWFSRGFVLKYRAFLPKVVERCQCLLTVSETSKADILNHFNLPEERVHVVPVGVDDFQAEPDADPLPEVLEGLHKGAYYLAVGSLDPRKNLDYLARVWARFKGAGGMGQLVIVGGSSRAFRKTSFPDLQDCLIAGYQPDSVLTRLLKGARALITPSLYEGFSIPPLEAMRLGTPAIISDIPVHRENFAGLATFIHPQMEDSLFEVLMEGAFAPPDTARLEKLLQEKFNWDLSAERIYGILRSMSER